MLYIILILLLVLSIKISKRKLNSLIIIWLSVITIIGLIIISSNEVEETIPYDGIDIESIVNVEEIIDFEEVGEAGDLYVHFIDVGQADSIFIDYGDYEILIDAGNNGDGALVVDYIKPYTDEIELLIASHPHEDHIGGLDDVISNYDIIEIIDSGLKADTKTYKDYYDSVLLENAKYNEDSSTSIYVDEYLEIEIYETGDDFINTNDNSVVVKINYVDTSFLFTGDMEEKAEAEALLYDLSANVLKASHHGSKTSSTKEFLDMVNPDIIVISVGKDNKYKHPSTETMLRFLDYTEEIYLTSDEGHIVLKSDGVNINKQ